MAPRRDTPPSWDEYARELGHRLTEARRASGLSQERVAHLAGIAAYTYQKFEKGESKPGSPANPRLTTLVALSQVLQLPLDEMLPAPLPHLADDSGATRRDARD